MSLTAITQNSTFNLFSNLLINNLFKVHPLSDSGCGCLVIIYAGVDFS